MMNEMDYSCLVGEDLYDMHHTGSGLVRRSLAVVVVLHIYKHNISLYLFSSFDACLMM